jgi:aminopeptidase N
MITHIVDFLFVYDFEDETKNKIIKRQSIEPQSETVFNFSNKLMPKIVFLNYNDYGYMKLDLSYMNMEELKQYLIKCKQTLIKAALYRALFDTFKDSKISSIEFLEVTFETIKTEADEETVSVLLGYISDVIKNYLPTKLIAEYKTKFFKISKDLIEGELSRINFNKVKVKHFLTYLNQFATNEEDKKYLIRLLNLDTNLITQSRRFLYVKSIYTSRIIPLEEKETLLNREIKRDKNSGDSLVAKILCNAALPDRANKERLWKKITEECNSDSLTNMEAIMRGFAPVEQCDLFEDFLTQKFFEVLPKIGKGNEAFYVKYFITYLFSWFVYYWSCEYLFVSPTIIISHIQRTWAYL